MAAIYCANIDCGSKSEYIGVKPKFCATCGTSFDAAFKRATPTFVEAAAAPQPKPHVGSFQQHTYAPRPEDIVAEINLDASFIRVETERPKKVTVADLQRMGGDISFTRDDAASRGTTPAGTVGFRQFEDQIFKKMLGSAEQTPQA